MSAKLRQRVRANMKELDAFAPYCYDDENHIDSLTKFGEVETKKIMGNKDS
jgi:hypothetical protein